MVMPVDEGQANASLAPWARGLLRTIYGSESAYPGRDPYRVMYGGRTISDFSDHPRQLIPIVSGPNATSRTGLRTSAAGGYQFLRGSWDEAKGALGLTDFSPGNQDKAAIWHAERTYKARTGRDLQADIEAAGGDPEKLTSVGRGLSGWWTSLPGGIEPNKATGSFGNRFAKNLSYAGTEEDPSKPALYSPMAYAGDQNMPLQIGVRPRGTDERAPDQFVDQYKPVAERGPVNFSDDPLSWIRGRNEYGYNFPKGLLAAASALMSVNNPKGAAALQGLIPAEDTPEYAVQMSQDGQQALLLDRKSGRTQTIPTGFKPPVQEFEKVGSPDMKSLLDAQSSALPIANSARSAKDFVKLLDNGKISTDVWSRGWGAVNSVLGQTDEGQRLLNQLNSFVEDLTADRLHANTGTQTDKDYEVAKKGIVSALASNDPKSMRDALAKYIEISNKVSGQNLKNTVAAHEANNPKANPQVFSPFKKAIDEQDRSYQDWLEYDRSFKAKARSTDATKGSSDWWKSRVTVKPRYQ